VDYKNERIPELKIEVNLIETESEFIIEAPVPGIPSENISVNVADDTITVEATWPEKKTIVEKDGKPIYKEFMKANMSRSIILPNTFDKDSQHADLHNGLLTIHLKKRKRQKPHNINITDEGDE
jgi:HSP20 family protein